MWIEKRILVPQRVRRPPKAGFSWIDRRFVREFAPALSREAVLLYFFLAAVADKHGLSYYKDETLARRLELGLAALAQAREALIHRDLLAWQPPLVQVLSLPAPPPPCPEPVPLGVILRRLPEGGAPCK